jgi:metal-responsive CopG/Arc/MetJ family transcriptional regulator
MVPPSPKCSISVTVDANLLAEIDALTGDRAAAIEEALRLWRAQKIQAQLQQYYLNRSEADRQEEEAWADATQDAAIQAWDEEESSN